MRGHAIAQHSASRKEGIFCIEGLWDSDLRRHLSVQPMLHLLREAGDVPVIHRTAATLAEADYWLRRYRRHRRFPILYLSAHGDRGVVCFEDGSLELSDLAEKLAGGCRNAVIHFGSCGTIGALAACRGLLRRTGALALTGYGTDVDWVESAALDLLLFGCLQDNAFDVSGAKAVKKRLLSDCGTLAKRLKFRMIIRE